MFGGQAYAVIWIDEEAQETELVGERDHAATQPRKCFLFPSRCDIYQRLFFSLARLVRLMK
jgi:hypothetical protein